MKKRIGLFVIGLILVMTIVGCEDNYDKSSPSAIKEDSKPTIRYVIVEIEGKRWLATPGSHGEWSLAGPID